MLTGKLSRREFLWRSFVFAAATATAGDYCFNSSPPGIIGANDRVRVGIIGLGERGRKHLAEYLKLPNVEIAAICDSDTSNLLKVSQEFDRSGLPRPFLATDYRRLLDQPDIDVLSVATPKENRVGIGIIALQTGRHLLLEKPFSASIAEGERLVETATQSERLVQQRENHSFAPFIEISALAQSVELDDIRAVVSRKRVTIPPSLSLIQNVNQQNNQNEINYGKLMEFALDELDMARCLMSVDAPSRVTAVALKNGISGSPAPVKISLRYDFGHETKKTKLNFDISINYSSERISSGKGNAAFLQIPASPEPEFESRSSFRSANGWLTVECGSAFEALNSQNNSWENLISCVRANNSKNLQNPIREAHKSCNLLHLAEAALKSRG